MKLNENQLQDNGIMVIEKLDLSLAIWIRHKERGPCGAPRATYSCKCRWCEEAGEKLECKRWTVSGNLPPSFLLCTTCSATQARFGWRNTTTYSSLLITILPDLLPEMGLCVPGLLCISYKLLKSCGSACCSYCFYQPRWLTLPLLPLFVNATAWAIHTLRLRDAMDLIQPLT